MEKWKRRNRREKDQEGGQKNQENFFLFFISFLGCRLYSFLESMVICCNHKTEKNLVKKINNHKYIFFFFHPRPAGWPRERISQDLMVFFPSSSSSFFNFNFLVCFCSWGYHLYTLECIQGKLSWKFEFSFEYFRRISMDLWLKMLCVPFFTWQLSFCSDQIKSIWNNEPSG